MSPKTDVIAELRAIVAELEVENARLKFDNIAFARNLKGKAETTGATYEHLCSQLLLAQAEIKRLRDALEYHQEQTRPIARTVEALAQPSDTSALDAYVAEKVKEALK